MASVKVALLVIFLYYLLSLSHLLLKIPVKFAIALDIPKAFDRVWYKASISKLPSCGFYPLLFLF